MTWLASARFERVMDRSHEGARMNVLDQIGKSQLVDWLSSKMCDLLVGDGCRGRRVRPRSTGR